MVKQLKSDQASLFPPAYYYQKLKPKFYFRFLEHVVSPIHVTAGRKRGDFRVYLQSPRGTRSTLLHNRPQDFSSSGFTNWPFMTTHS